MSISILNRGASGGLKPELIVIAPSGSTIDLLQNGIIVDTYTIGASETEHTFVVKVGTYTVRGTLGTKVQSKEVVIEVAGQYKVEIDYKLWLYREGDECEDVTGGWQIYSIAGYTYSLAKNTSNMVASSNSSTNYESALATKNTVPLDNFATLHIEWDVDIGSWAQYTNAYVGVADSCPNNGFTKAIYYNSNNKPPKIVSIDISGITKASYPKIYLNTGGGGVLKATIHKIWLE